MERRFVLLRLKRTKIRFLKKIGKKTLFWHFGTLVARGILLYPLPYYIIPGCNGFWGTLKGGDIQAQGETLGS